MLRKNIVSGTGVDRQNQQILLPALISYADQLNNADTVPRMGLNHDRTLLPVGKVISGELIPRDGEVLFEATIDDFIDELYVSAIQNPLYRNVLKNVGNKYILHALGEKSKDDTVFTRYEFEYELNALKTFIQANY